MTVYQTLIMIMNNLPSFDFWLNYSYATTQHFLKSKFFNIFRFIWGLDLYYHKSIMLCFYVHFDLPV